MVIKQQLILKKGCFVSLFEALNDKKNLYGLRTFFLYCKNSHFHYLFAALQERLLFSCIFLAEMNERKK